jgi:CubicO group peptidase (beta-lactamase class C family)
MTAVKSSTYALLLMLLTFLAQGAVAEETAWPVPDWQTATPASQNISAEGLDKLHAWFKENGSKTGVLIRHGRIVAEWYFDDAKPDSKYLVYSTTKSFASTAAGLAIADGKLSLDTNVGSLLPDVKPEEKRDVTVRQLISMSSGVHNEPKIHTMDKLFSYSLYEAPMDHRPGTKWDYNNTGLALLSPVMVKATGKEIDVYLNEKVFQPIGIKQDDWSWEQRENHALPYSGLHITARALARFGLMFLNGGKWQDKAIVPGNWVSEATAPSQEMNKTYGYLWWNNSTGAKWPGVPSDAYASLGRFDNNMLIVPSLDLILIRQVGEEQDPKRKVNFAAAAKLAVEAVTDRKN